jgi:hypothetical protein
VKSVLSIETLIVFFIYCLVAEIFHWLVSQLRIASWFVLIGQKNEEVAKTPFSFTFW